MKNISKSIAYGVGGILFVLSFFLMIYFGKETFHVQEREQVKAVQEDPLHIVLIPEEMNNPYWRMIERGAKKVASEHNVYLEYEGPKQADNDEQLRILDKMIDAEVDGILVQGVEDERFVQLVTLAREKGIPVVTLDGDVPMSSRNAYVGMDNYRAGYVAGKSLIYETTGEQFVGIIAGRLDSVHQRERIRGFKEAIKQEKRIQLLTIKESSLTTIGAAQATYQLFKQYPEVTAIFGASILDGDGILQGMEQMNRSKRKATIITIDTLSQAKAYLKEGYVDASIIQYPEQMGEKGMTLMLGFLEGQYADALQHTPIELITKEEVRIEEQQGKGEQP